MKLLDEIHIKDLSFKKDSWGEKFLCLKRYYEKHGRLPNYNERFGTKKIIFGTWAIRQRMDFYKGKLPKGRQEKLLSIGFNLNAQQEKEDLWNERFELLKQWLKDNGNRFPNNPLSKDALEKTVSIFVNYNRSWYNGKLDKYGDFPEDRKKMLDSIGFEWNPKANDKKWEVKLEAAKEQIKKYGNIPWKIDGKTNAVYTWLVNQKIAFRNNKLDREKIGKIKKIGIDLEV